jgi:polysaccharide biosynthesis transport protein
VSSVSNDSAIAALEAQLAELDGQQDAATVTGLDDARVHLRVRLASASVARHAVPAHLELIAPARTPAVAESPCPARNGLAAGLFTTFTVSALLAVITTLDPRARSSLELAAAATAPRFAHVPGSPLGRGTVPTATAAYLRTLIESATPRGDPRVILLTDTIPGHGSSTVAMALSERLACRGCRTVLIDANLRRPLVAREYGLSPFDVVSLLDTLETPDRSPAPSPALIHGCD